MHPIDRLARVAFRLDRKRLAVFPDGWGDREAIELLHQLPAPSPAQSVEVVWGRKQEHPHYRVRRGQYTSPAAGILPVEARAGDVVWIEPGAGAKGTVVLFPAWNDHGFTARSRLASHLVEHGIGSLIFEAPFYGSRRVVPEPRQAIRTVADFARLGYASVVEGRSLVALAARTGPAGVSGYSMGGNLAALAAATLPSPIATAPLAASHAPGPVYLDGVLSAAIAWDRIGGRETAEPELRHHLSAASVLEIAPLPHLREAVIVGARRDGFIPRTATEALARHWEGSELRWIDAGHATLLWRHRPELADAIRAAFARLSTSASSP